MAKFIENNLKLEETLGGYNVGEPDDDIFQIKDEEYPDNIQDFIYEEPQIIEQEQELEVIEEVISEELSPETSEIIKEDFAESEIVTPTSEEADSNNIWDSFGGDNEEPVKTNIIDESEDLLTSNPISPSEIIEEIEKEEIKEEVQEQNILETNQDMNFALDDDFKKQLAAQLSASKAKKKQEEKAEENLVIPPVEKLDFVPVDGFDNTKVYDLSEFGNDRPSEKSDAKPTIEQDAKEDEKDKKEEKRRLPWLLGISAASLIILAGLAYLILYYLIPNFYHKEEIVKKDSTNIEQKITLKDTISKSVIEKEVDKNTEIEANKEVVKESEAEIIARINNEFAKNEEKVIKEDVKKEQKVATKQEITKDIKKDKEKQEKVIKKNLNTKVIERPKITKESQVPPKKQEKKQDIVKQTVPTNELTKEEIKSEQVYTIQVYSSPSQEDALDWIVKLKNKNIQANLSEQMIRDVKWYRVRFGNFSTREEAKAVALRYGFSQTWIDRVK